MSVELWHRMRSWKRLFIFFEVNHLQNVRFKFFTMTFCIYMSNHWGKNAEINLTIIQIFISDILYILFGFLICWQPYKNKRGCWNNKNAEPMKAVRTDMGLRMSCVRVSCSELRTTSTTWYVFAKEQRTQQICWRISGLGVFWQRRSQAEHRQSWPNLLKEKLGEGTFAIVTHVFNVRTGKEYARKEPRNKSKSKYKLQDWKNEAVIMSSIQHVSTDLEFWSYVS